MRQSRWTDFRTLINQKARETAAITSSLLIGALAVLLLGLGYLEGAAFVSMLGLSFLVGFVIALWGGFSELSILGSSVRLKELTGEAEKAIKSLEHGRVTVYRQILTLTMRHHGGITGYCDRRIPEFFEVVAEIKRQGLYNDLSNQVLELAGELLVQQQRNLKILKNPKSGLALKGDSAEQQMEELESWLCQMEEDNFSESSEADYRHYLDVKGAFENLKNLLAFRLD